MNPPEQLTYVFPSAYDDTVNHRIPGVARYAQSAKIYGWWVMPVDRTGHIRIPLKIRSLFPMPPMRTFTRTYEDICNDRAKGVLMHAETLGVSLYVMYSGGIDSTCMLVSLLKHATVEQKRNITVLLSRESIIENPRFYDEHIRGKLRTRSSLMFPSFIGGNDILLSAEHNDLVMGNAVFGPMIEKYGMQSMRRPYDRELIVDFFAQKLKGDEAAAHFYFDLFDRLAKSAPMDIRTNLDYMWWYNFAAKWQACFCLILFHALPSRVANINMEHLRTRFISFYNTEEFQLWSMNNLDKRIKDTWKSYKWIMKDIIYEFNRDADYREHKTKVRSLPIIMKLHDIHNPFLDENVRFRNDLKLGDYLNPENDFV